MNWIPMMNWTPNINWLSRSIANNNLNKTLDYNQSDKINDYKKSNLLIISDMDDIINKLDMYNIINLFCSKKYNLNFIKTNKKYDYSIEKISDNINSVDNDIYIIVSSVSSIYIVDSILKFKHFNKIKKIIFISPFILSLKQNITIKPKHTGLKKKVWDQ